MRAFRLRPALWPVALASTVIVIALVATLNEARWAVLLIGASLLGLYLVLRALYDPDARAEQVDVTADAKELSFGRHRLSTLAIRRARVMPQEIGARVEIDRGYLRPPLRLELDSIVDAREIAAALGYDASRTRDRFRMVSPAARSIWFHLALQGALQVVMRVESFSWVTALGALVLLIVFIDERARYVEIGPDGVFLRTLYSRMHIPTSALRGVRRSREERACRELVFDAAGQSPTAWMYEKEVTAFENRVAELIAARDGDSRGTNFDAKLLAGRSSAELRALGSRAATFRAEGMDRDTLLRIAEDVHVAPALRARAAVALPADDAEVRVRVHAIAANATLPELRAALERSASENESVDEALRELDRAVARFGGRS